MRPLTLAALGAAAYAAFLVALMPASFVASRLAQATRGAMLVQQASGTAWNGRGRATVATPAGPLAIDELRWRLLPARIFTGRLAFAVEGRSAGFVAAGELGRSLGAWEARGLSVTGQASGATSFLPLLAHWRPQGELAVRVPRLAWHEDGARGEANLEWRNAALALSDVRPLGTYRVELRGEGGPASVTLATLEGPLRITGKGTVSPPSRWTFTGEARADAAAASGLQALLDLLGPRRADGSRAIEWKSR